MKLKDEKELMNASFIDFNQELRNHGFKMWRTPGKMGVSVDDMEKEINGYFNLCDEYKELPSIKGLCVYLGISVKTYNDNICNPESAFRDLYQGAKDYIHSVVENRAMMGKLSSSVYTFTAQNFYDMADKQTINVENNTQLSVNVANSEATIEALKKELLKQKDNKVQIVPEDAIIVKEGGYIDGDTKNGPGVE